MQADWEFEVGPGAPMIDAAWSGLVDLRRHPERISEIPEIAAVPALGPALLQLNGNSSPVWTSKCDVWTPESVDPDELDAPFADFALACYIDLLPRIPREWSNPAEVECLCRRICADLHSNPACSCRVDLVVRRAVLDEVTDGLGMTAYLTACGATGGDASSTLSVTLGALADSVCAGEGAEKTTQKATMESGGRVAQSDRARAF